jgi:uncharacterized membrane protein
MLTVAVSDYHTAAGYKRESSHWGWLFMKFDNRAVKRGAMAGSVRVQNEGAVADEACGQDAHSRSLLKAISWRLTGTLDTFVIGFIVTGKLSIAGSIAATELFSKIALYYGHERMWAMIHWGRS